MTDETQAETTEGRKARQHKAALSAVLQELVDTMEGTRKDGFIVEFSIQPNADGEYALSNLTVLKRW